MTHKLKSILLYFLICISNIIYAQNIDKGKVLGKLIEVNSNKPVQYATISIYSTKDSLLVSGTISDSLGVFAIEKIKNGDYYLLVSALGFQKKVISNVTFSSEKQFINIGIVNIEIDYMVIEEIEVVGDKKLIVLKPDRKVIQVESSIAASGGSAADVLQLIPEIKVDQGSITLKNQSFTVLLNGKPSGITPSQLLQFPASLIEQIEVITNPSVKYNPQGLGGIVNLKLKKRVVGLNSVIQLTGGSDNCYNGSGTINYATSKFNFFTSVNGNYYNGESVGYLNATVFNSSQLHEIFENDVNLKRYSIKVGFDLEPDSSNLFTFFWSQPNDIGDFSTLSTTVNYFSETTVKYRGEVSFLNKFKQNDFSLSYKHLFPRKETEFTIDVLHSRNSQKETYETLVNYFEPNVLTTKYSLSPQGQALLTDIQCNLSIPLSSKILFESGLNTSITSEVHENSGKTFNFNTQNWNDSLLIRNTFNFDEKILGAFILFSSSFDKFNFQIGGRGEYTSTNSLLVNSNKQTDNEYFNWFSSAGFTFSATENMDLGFSYSSRIERPNALQLNPFIIMGDHFSEQYMGNPSLKPAYTNSFEFTFMQNWSNITLNSSLSYMNSDDIIDRFYYITANSIKIKTWANISEVNNYMFNGSISWKISKSIRTNFSSSVYKKEMFSSINSYISHFGYDFRSISRINFGKDFSLNLSLIYYGPTYYNSYKRDQVFKISLAARKNITKKFIISVRLNDILNSKTRYSDWSNEYTSNSEINNNYRAVYVGVMYKFGKDIKTKAKIDLNTKELRMQRD